MRSDSTSEKPMIALSGVRSSWDMFARNSDLCWLATSSWRLFSSISRKSRAFWMARADWVAKVWSSATSSAANVPVRLRITMSAPTSWSSAMSGTASSARNPMCRRVCRTRLS